MGPNKQKGKWGVCVYAHECACLWILLKLTLYNKRNAISSHSPYCYSMFCPKTPSVHISLSPTLRKSWLGHQQNRTYIFGFQFYIIFSHRMVSFAGTSQSFIYNQNNTRCGRAMDGQPCYCHGGLLWQLHHFTSMPNSDTTAQHQVLSTQWLP